MQDWYLGVSSHHMHGGINRETRLCVDLFVKMTVVICLNYSKCWFLFVYRIHYIWWHYVLIVKIEIF